MNQIGGKARPKLPNHLKLLKNVFQGQEEREGQTRQECVKVVRDRYKLGQIFLSCFCEILSRILTAKARGHAS